VNCLDCIAPTTILRIENSLTGGPSRPTKHNLLYCDHYKNQPNMKRYSQRCLRGFKSFL